MEKNDLDKIEECFEQLRRIDKELDYIRIQTLDWRQERQRVSDDTGNGYIYSNPLPPIEQYRIETMCPNCSKVFIFLGEIQGNKWTESSNQEFRFIRKHKKECK